MADIMIIDAATGEVTERDFTPEEIAQREADQAAAAEAEAERAAAEASAIAARASAFAKLAALGLDEAELNAIVGA